MLALGVLIETTIRDKIRFIENYNGAILPALLLSIGATSVVAHLVCGKICWTNHNPVRRRLWSRYLLPTMIVSTVIFLLELVSGIMCYSHVTELDKSFKRGILTNMKDYKDDVNVKEEVDVLQIEFSCCGSIAYTDWFRTAWIHEDYLNDLKLQSLRKSGFDDGFISDDVPFSCCSPTSMRPCIHHHVHDNDLHYNYDYRTSMTINKKGCAITLMEYYSEWILMKAGAIAIGLSFFQVRFWLYIISLVDNNIAIDHPLSCIKSMENSSARLCPDFVPASNNDQSKCFRKLETLKQENRPEIYFKQFKGFWAFGHWNSCGA
ncbi:hypothetical protein CHS0354_032546 [Potamilus streckersoni]|uniref:Uncharacterized protein n=1 Tax=Potamilus streckersoni TaxID=2493646 RepID=A0AAE0VZ39_9BIVA|nr:hypothetical protein CHS0354_032546 [Potamilus streckersoni]